MRWAHFASLLVISVVVVELFALLIVLPWWRNPWHEIFALGLGRAVAAPSADDPNPAVGAITEVSSSTATSQP